MINMPSHHITSFFNISHICLLTLKSKSLNNAELWNRLIHKKHVMCAPKITLT